MKSLVVYYSKSGNNAYLAQKIADSLGGEREAIRPRANVFPALLLFSALKISPGIKPLTHRVDDYDAVILCGPIWMGQVISPLRDVLKQYGSRINRLYFATCCGGGDEQKDGKFGYASVFQQVRQAAGDTVAHCEAFPISLIVPEDKAGDGDAVMKTRLSDQNFSGPLQERFEQFITNITG